MNFKSYILIAVLFALCSCDRYKKEDFVFDQTDGIKYELFDTYVDRYGNEGVVIRAGYDITILYKYEERCIWGLDGGPFLASSTSIKNEFNFNRIANTQIAQRLGISEFPAFDWAFSLNNSSNVADALSWTLPALEDYVCIYSNITEINKKLIEIGGDPLSVDEGTYYWIATPEDENTSWAYNFTEPKNVYFTYRARNRRARAVKLIKYQL